jgi:hypothetical protein
MNNKLKINFILFGIIFSFILGLIISSLTSAFIYAFFFGGFSILVGIILEDIKLLKKLKTNLSILFLSMRNNFSVIIFIITFFVLVFFLISDLTKRIKIDYDIIIVTEPLYPWIIKFIISIMILIAFMNILNYINSKLIFLKLKKKVSINYEQIIAYIFCEIKIKKKYSLNYNNKNDKRLEVGVALTNKNNIYVMSSTDLTKKEFFIIDNKTIQNYELTTENEIYKIDENIKKQNTLLIIYTKNIVYFFTIRKSLFNNNKIIKFIEEIKLRYSNNNRNI